MNTPQPNNDKVKGLEVEIERAKPSDARAIMTIKRDAWLVAYTSRELGITKGDLLKKLGDFEHAVAGWEAGIATESETSDKLTFVARVNGKVVGYTSPDTQEGKRHLGALYVSPRVQGSGVGTQLLQKALEWHGQDSDVYIDVVKHNKNAIKFYEKNGFTKTGSERPQEFDAKACIKLLADIEMVHPVTSPQ